MPLVPPSSDGPPNSPELPSADHPVKGPANGVEVSENEAVKISENGAADEATNTDTDEPWIPDDEWTTSTGGAQKHSAELFPVPPPNQSSTGNQAQVSGGSGTVTQSHRQAVGPLPLVETAFLASAASLMWLVNTYLPPGPLLRILFPLPIALVYLRWDLRSAWMAATVSGLLLTILLGPTRSIFFVMPYGLLGVQLGYLWCRQARWETSIITGGVLVALGTFFRLWLLSLLAGEDLWGYLIAQITQLIDWALRLLTNWGWISLGAFGQPSMEVVALVAVGMVFFSSMVYLFTVHLAAWLVLERLGIAMPEPPRWVQVLIEE